MSGIEAGTRILHPCLGHPVEGSRQIEVVAVQIGPEIAGGPRHPLVDRVALAPVLATFPVGEPVGVPPDDLDRAVRRAAIDDDVFEVRIALVEDRADRRLEEPGLVEARRDNGDARQFSFSHLCKYSLELDEVPRKQPAAEVTPSRSFFSSRRPASPASAHRPAIGAKRAAWRGRSARKWAVAHRSHAKQVRRSVPGRSSR